VYSNLIKRCNKPGALYTNTRIVPTCFGISVIYMGTIKYNEKIFETVTYPTTSKRKSKGDTCTIQVKCIDVITNNKVITA
jgi:hypothetical protein